MPSVESFAEGLPGGDTKIGGKSIYLYGFVIAGVVVVYLWWNARGTNPVAEDVAAMGGDALPSVAGDLGDLTPSTGSGNSQTDNSSNTNAAWEITTVGWLITKGVSGLKAQTALEKYLGGEVLTYDESQIVNMAIEHNGLPPEGLLNRPQGTDTPPSTTAPKIEWHNETKTWTAIGNIPRFKQVGDNAFKPYGTDKSGSKITTVQWATYNGEKYRRAPNGVAFRQADLAPYVAPKKKKK